MICHWCKKPLTEDSLGTLTDSTGGDVCGTRDAQDLTVQGWVNPPHVPAVERKDFNDAMHLIRELIISADREGARVLAEFLTPDQVRALAEDYRR